MKVILLSCLVYATILNNNSQLPVSGIFAAANISATPNEHAIISQFICTIEKDRVLLTWVIDNNEVADQIEVESSTDGKSFAMTALVFSTEKKDGEDYYFYEKAKKSKTFYRLKIINRDQSIEYSSIVSPA